MARQRTTFRSSQSIAGAVLVGLGIFILYENLTVSVAWLRHVLGANSSEALGVLPAVILTISQVLQAHAANHQRFLQAFFQHILAASWPLLLVTVGMAYRGISSRTISTQLTRKIVQLSI